MNCNIYRGLDISIIFDVVEAKLERGFSVGHRGVFVRRRTDIRNSAPLNFHKWQVWSHT